MRRERTSGAGRPERGFTLLEVLIVIAVITFLMGVLVVAFTGVRERVLRDKTRTMIRAVDAAMSQYYLHFHVWPPDSHSAASSLNPVEGSECIIYYLTTPFRLDETIMGETDPDKKALMVRSDRDAGPFYDVERKHLKDIDGDTYMSLLDPMGQEFHYDQAPTPADFNDQAVNNHSFNLWSDGANRVDDKGEQDDVTNWHTAQ